MSLSIEGNVKLDIKYVALFEGDDEFDEEFQQSAFPRVNAPAIAYPFLRAFIGTFLLNGGYEPIMLPSVNFSALYKSEK
ncbi:protein-export chaperone SecB [Vibrio cholerae]